MTFGLMAPVLAMPGKEKPYWLYFADGRLVQWGEAGDWRREADRIFSSCLLRQGHGQVVKVPSLITGLGRDDAYHGRQHLYRQGWV
jgi:hypothetical protein